MFSIFKKQDNTPPAPLNEDIYLVTKAVDTKSLAKEQKLEDLEELAGAESKKEYKSNIARSIANPSISRAATALQMRNPFKGV